MVKLGNTEMNSRCYRKQLTTNKINTADMGEEQMMVFLLLIQ